MRMAELSERSGVPIPTIRYYLREGLVPQGRLTSPNQATYDDAHVHRLALIRAMVDVGGMPIAAVRKVVDHLGASDADELTTLGMVQYTLVRATAAAPTDESADETAGGRDEVQALLDRLAWHVRPEHPARTALAAAIESLRRLGQDDVLALVDRYAAAAHELAAAEIALTLARDGVDARAEAVVMVGVLGDAILDALRRLAAEDVIVRTLGSSPDASAPATSA